MTDRKPRVYSTVYSSINGKTPIALNPVNPEASLNSWKSPAGIPTSSAQAYGISMACRAFRLLPGGVAPFRRRGSLSVPQASILDVREKASLVPRSRLLWECKAAKPNKQPWTETEGALPSSYAGREAIL